MKISGRSDPETLRGLASGFMSTQAIYASAKLGLASQMSNGPKTSAELAKAVGADANAMYKLLRFLESIGIVTEPKPGTFGLTEIGELLLPDSGSGIHEQVIFDVELSWPYWGDLLYTVSTGQPADRHLYGKPFFEHLHENPELTALFDEGMTRFIGTMASAVASSYDFKPFKTIVDIGGGHGLLLGAILTKNPHAQGVLFDLPKTVEGAKQHLVETGLSGRCSFVSGDFFESVPHGDVIMLSAILSDWDDEKSVRILSICRRSIAPEGRLLIIERLVNPDEPAPPTAFLDLQMLLIGGGTGRTQDQYRMLLKAAGFELLHIIPTGSQRSIFEAKQIPTDK